MNYTDLPTFYRNWVEKKAITKDEALSIWNASTYYREFTRSVIASHAYRAAAEGRGEDFSSAVSMCAQVTGDTIRLR